MPGKCQFHDHLKTQESCILVVCLDALLFITTYGTQITKFRACLWISVEYYIN